MKARFEPAMGVFGSRANFSFDAADSNMEGSQLDCNWLGGLMVGFGSCFRVGLLERSRKRCDADLLHLDRRGSISMTRYTILVGRFLGKGEARAFVPRLAPKEVA